LSKTIMKLFQPKARNATPAGPSRQEALQCCPVINSSVSISTNQDGDILLEYPLMLRPLFQSLFKRFQKDNSLPTKKLVLDDMGGSVWKMIDGKNSVKTIITQFAKQQGITTVEAEKSVTLFLSELGRRGLIAMK